MPSLSPLRSRVAALPRHRPPRRGPRRARCRGRRGSRRSPPDPRLRPGAHPHGCPRPRRHRHRPRGRGPEPPPRRSLWSRARSRSSPRGRRCRTSSSPRSDTVGQRLSVLRRLVHPETGDDTGRRGSRTSSHRFARCSSRSSKGLGDLEPVRFAPARDADRPGRRPRGRRLHRADLVDVAASSPCAAASSTCSRPPRSIRSAWSSGATRSRRSASSRSPTSAPWKARAQLVGAAVPRAAAHAAVRERARRSPTTARGRPLAGDPRATASPSRAWSRSRPSSSTAWSR